MVSEALRCVREAIDVAKLKDPQLQERAYRCLAGAIVKRVSGRSPPPAYVVPSGWSRHALYVSLEPSLRGSRNMREPSARHACSETMTG